jgi:hypothetical protein
MFYAYVVYLLKEAGCMTDEYKAPEFFEVFKLFSWL